MHIGAEELFTGFANGTGQIWLANVQCDGNETRLIDCPASPLGENRCNHGEDAGVVCQPRKFKCVVVDLS